MHEMVSTVGRLDLGVRKSSQKLNGRGNIGLLMSPCDYQVTTAISECKDYRMMNRLTYVSHLTVWRSNRASAYYGVAS